jgi:flagellar motor switch protein FliN/FliY
MTASQFSWLPRLQRVALETTVVPMVGGLPPFPIETVEKKLQEVLHLRPLVLKADPPEFLEPAAGADLAIELESQENRSLRMHLRAAPLPGTATIMLDADALWSLLHTALGKPLEGLVPLVDSDINEGFGTFLFCAVLNALNTVHFPPHSRLEMAPAADGLPAAKISVRLQHGEQTLPMHLVLTEKMLQALRQEMEPRPLTQLNPELASLLDLQVHLPIGRVSLGWRELKKLKVGDVAILDHFDLDLATGEGTTLLRVGAKDVWSCRLSQGQLLVEEPFPASAEDQAMSFTPESDDDLFEDLDEDLDQIGSFDDYELDQMPAGHAEEGLAENAEAAAESKAEVPRKKGKQSALAEKLQVQLTISIGTMTLSARELFELKPGNVLNLPSPVTAQVELIVGADSIGRGELVQLGDAIGVRILEL